MSSFKVRLGRLGNDKLGGYFPYSAEIIFRNDELSKKLQTYGDNNIKFVELLNKYEGFRQILYKNGADDVSITELNRHEYLQIRFSQVDNISRNILWFDLHNVAHAMLRHYPKLTGYYQRFRNADWLLQACDKYFEIFINDPHFMLQEPLMSGYVFLPESVRNILKTKTAF